MPENPHRYYSDLDAQALRDEEALTQTLTDYMVVAQTSGWRMAKLDNYDPNLMQYHYEEAMRQCGNLHEIPTRPKAALDAWFARADACLRRVPRDDDAVGWYVRALHAGAAMQGFAVPVEKLPQDAINRINVTAGRNTVERVKDYPWQPPRLGGAPQVESPYALVGFSLELPEPGRSTSRRYEVIDYTTSAMNGCHYVLQDEDNNIRRVLEEDIESHKHTALRIAA